MFEKAKEVASFQMNQAVNHKPDKGKMTLDELLYNRALLKEFKNERSKGTFKDFDAKTALS